MTNKNIDMQFSAHNAFWNYLHKVRCTLKKKSSAYINLKYLAIVANIQLYNKSSTFLN